MPNEKVYAYAAMRLFLAALTVIGTFLLVVLLILRLFPEGGWPGVFIAVTCLYASAFAAWALMGNEKASRTKKGGERRRLIFRDNLLYFSIAMALVTVGIAVAIHDTERGIHRNYKNDWFVGFGSACVALGYAAKVFWSFRKSWHLWAGITALFLAFTAITIPILSRMQKVPLLWMGPLCNIELLVAIALLGWILVPRSPRRDFFPR